ncbi:MAG: hypothetical protein GX579_12705 [Chloroflexi bacterium]|nr:hypothetical protein [Chloroflexota bacterium]
MKRRWLVYLAIGAVFGAFDFYYLGFLYELAGPQVLFASFPAGRFLHWLMLNLGVWLVPVVPIALYEVRVSRARLRSALASLTAWCAAIVAYYLTNAVQLAFVGVPGRPELHISNRSAPHFWQNWAFVLRRNILAGITEWMMVAVVGGAIVGLAVGSLYLLCRPSPQGTSARHDAGVTA